MNRKTIIEWMRQMLHKENVDLKDLPSPTQQTVDRLIERAARETHRGLEQPVAPEEFDNPDNAENADNSDNPSCSYMLKRNIVASLEEIRKFAEEHHLASAMVKALLTLLAEMVINALKGKVSGAALAVLLNALNFDKARSEAYREGEIAGRNAQIIEKHFPSTDDGLPHLSGGANPEKEGVDIFSIAKQAKDRL